MRLTAAIKGDLREFLEGEQTELAREIRLAVTAAAEGLRDDLRAQVRAAGLGPGLEKAWRSEVYPKSSRSRTLRPAGLVWSKAQVLHQAYVDGPTIIAGKRWLVIATPAAVAMGFGYSAGLPRGNRAIPAGAKRKYSQLGAAIARLGRQNLRLVPAKSKGRMVVVYDPPGAARGGGKGRGVVLFVLTRQVKVRRLLDFDGPAETWLDAMYARLAALG